MDVGWSTGVSPFSGRFDFVAGDDIEGLEQRFHLLARETVDERQFSGAVAFSEELGGKDSARAQRRNNALPH